MINKEATLGVDLRRSADPLRRRPPRRASVQGAHHAVRRDGSSRPGRGGGHRRRLLVLSAAALVVVLSGAVSAWLLLGPVPGRAPVATAAAAGSAEDGPRVVTLEELQRVAAEGVPVYWAGVRPDEEYELTRTASGAVFVRYLPAGAPAGVGDAHLTVATYPGQRGASSLEAAAAEEGGSSWRTASGAFVLVDPRAPQSAYFSFDDADFQVEVYSPTTGAAQQLVLGGGISQVGPSSR